MEPDRQHRPTVVERGARSHTHAQPPWQHGRCTLVHGRCEGAPNAWTFLGIFLWLPQAVCGLIQRNIHLWHYCLATSSQSSELVFENTDAIGGAENAGVENVRQTTRNVLPSNRIRSQANLLLHTVIGRNKLSNGKGILLNENSFIIFFTTCWSVFKFKTSNLTALRFRRHAVWLPLPICFQFVTHCHWLKNWNSCLYYFTNKAHWLSPAYCSCTFFTEYRLRFMLTQTYTNVLRR